MFYDVSSTYGNTVRCMTMEEVHIVAKCLLYTDKEVRVKWYKEDSDKHTLGSWGYVEQFGEHGELDHVTAANTPIYWV